MANFIVNSSGIRAVRISKIDEVSIEEIGDPIKYYVIVRGGESSPRPEVIFEFADTLQEAQALAIPLMEALEASE